MLLCKSIVKLLFPVVKTMLLLSYNSILRPVNTESRTLIEDIPPANEDVPYPVITLLEPLKYSL